MAKLVVARIDRQPDLVEVGRKNLKRWKARQGGVLARCRQEWEELLERPWTEVRTILLEESDEGQRLRSSHPFVGLVTNEERRRIRETYRP